MVALDLKYFLIACLMETGPRSTFLTTPHMETRRILST